MLSSSTVQKEGPAATTNHIGGVSSSVVSSTTMSTSSSSSSSSLLLSIPTGAFLLVLCPFLNPCDIFNLRVVCRRLLELLHTEQYSDDVWKYLLQRYFNITIDSNTSVGSSILTALNIAPLSPPPTTTANGDLVPSIFGIHPESSNAIIHCKTPFEAFKYWIKCSRRFYAKEPACTVAGGSSGAGGVGVGGGRGGQQQPPPLPPPPIEMTLKELLQEQQQSASSNDTKGSNMILLLLDGPYFLRAIQFWKQIFDWLKNNASNNNNNHQNFGSRVREQLNSHRGLFHISWSESRNEIGLRACQAIYSFVGAPDAFELMNPPTPHAASAFERVFDGLLGGYQAYNFYSCTHLIRPRLTPSGSMIVATDPLTMSTGVKKMFCINCNTGMIEFHYGRTGIVPAIHESVFQERQQRVGEGGAAGAMTTTASSSNNDDDDDDANTTSHYATWDAFLIWLEEYANRLTTGQIGVGPMGSTPNDHQSILLYPRPTTTSGTGTNASTSSEGSSNIPTVSRAVTRGVEVIASAIYLPQAMTSHFGFIYNFRIRLLTPDDNEYQTPEQRGFETCQLMSRHWRITNSETNHTEHVNGEGVIGMYPILREGGYYEDGVSYDGDGTFSYTSCTGPIQGHFAGHLQFVPGSLNEPTGPPFPVEVKPFALDMNPSFLY